MKYRMLLLVLAVLSLVMLPALAQDVAPGEGGRIHCCKCGWRSQLSKSLDGE